MLTNSLVILSSLEHIDSLPLGNSPMVFGLHANAEIGYYSSAVKDMYLHLIDLQPQTGKTLLLMSFKFEVVKNE